ncbi:MAG TPA: hypothetical protein VF717_04525 [Pyrinomonadaceae bacterium]|jgi:protein involved in polysaccharide export with SLBB domain
MKKSILLLLLLVVAGLSCETAWAQKDDSGTVEVERVAVIGNVARPQEALLSATRTLTRALDWAGGVLPDTDMKRIKIFRMNGAQETLTLSVNLKAIRDRKAEDFKLQPYDIVCVPNKKSKGANCSFQMMQRLTPALPSRVIY